MAAPKNHPTRRGMTGAMTAAAATTHFKGSKRPCDPDSESQQNAATAASHPAAEHIIVKIESSMRHLPSVLALPVCHIGHPQKRVDPGEKRG